MEKNSIARSRDRSDWAQLYLIELIQKIECEQKIVNRIGYIETLSGYHLDIGFYSFFGEEKKHEFKQHLSLAMQLKLAAIGLNGYQRFTIGSEVLYSLLSENPILIENVARLETPEFINTRSNPLHAQFKVHMLQLAIQGDYEALQLKVNHLAKNGRKKDRELPAQGKDFFSLLMHGDKQGLEELISQHAKIKSQDVITEDFMCFEGTIEAKICWLKGIQVQIDNPLLPMGLMPMEPLDRYDDVYDFLQPGWTPPPQGIFDRLSGLFKK